MINRIKETIPHVAHASTLILFIKALVHDTKKTSGTGSTLSIVLARATSRLARMSPSGRWALTPPSHPYRPCGRRFFSSARSNPRGLLPVKKWNALCCPDFPLPAETGSGKPAYCFDVTKVLLFFELTKCRSTNVKMLVSDFNRC